MGRSRRLNRFWRFVRREGAEHYLLLALVGFGGSVSLVRFFLSATGYPKIGGGGLHIAHVLWGGLLLFVAALLPLIFANRTVYVLNALLAGVGVGLFIDEVGKFITENVDYFFPAAAPIIYLFFLATAFLFLWLRRRPRPDDRGDLNRALEALQQHLQVPLEPAEREDLELRLKLVAQNSMVVQYANLARLLLEYLQGDDRFYVHQPPAWWKKPLVRLDRWLKEGRLTGLLVFGLLVLSVLALKDPLGTLLDGHIPAFFSSILDIHSGRHFDPAIAPGAFEIRLALEIMAGLLYLSAAGFFVYRRPYYGIAFAYLALMIYLVGLNLLVFYFEQFSTIMLLGEQAALWLGLVYYRRRFMRSLGANPGLVGGFIRRLELAISIDIQEPLAQPLHEPEPITGGVLV